MPSQDGWIPLRGIPDSLVADLCCPLTRAALVQSGDWLYSTDPVARRKYPIRNGIPVLLIDAGIEVGEDELARVVGAARSERKE